MRLQDRVGEIPIWVTATPESVSRATELAREKLSENYSVEAAIVAVDEELNDLTLARAIVVHVSKEDDSGQVEKPLSWISIFLAILSAIGFLLAVVWLFSFVRPSSTFFAVLLIVIGQGMLFNMFKGSIRYATYSYLDYANENSYPTRMHPVKRSDSVANTIRLRRLRILLKDVANQIVQGGAPAQIESDLQTINLTAPAARRLVSLAKVKAFTQDMLPPYENRWLAYGLALAFIATCIIVVGRNNPPEGYTNYALAVSGWLAGDIARPKRRPRSRLS